ncbi:exported hypothetical protein [Mesotoga infera]|nr:exported hypothetical protein [Mesotoga infera]
MFGFRAVFINVLLVCLKSSPSCAQPWLWLATTDPGTADEILLATFAEQRTLGRTKTWFLTPALPSLLRYPLKVSMVSA